MNQKRWRQIEEVFEAALACRPQQRDSYLNTTCGADQELLRQVKAMLIADEKAGSFLEASVADLGAAVLFNGSAAKETLDPNINRRVGVYRLLRPIGSGGMGAVYLAERDDGEFEQKVAIKLIKRGIDTDFVLRRFRHERQILANLNHPNIAKLLDGGTTDDGLPYFVMECVEGEPINQFCTRHRLSVIERLQLFQQTCAAVTYAHNKKIVHRDIKPGNILVTPDGDVKLLDFGIAEILTGECREESTNSMARRLMTPEYSSPEQLRGLPLTTASDVFSLGVLLYELLTGRHPFKSAKISLLEISRLICEVDPEKPSVVVRRARHSALSADSPDECSNGAPPLLSSADAPEEAAELPEELEKIILKAIAKDPAGRYSFAGEMAADIRRYLRRRESLRLHVSETGRPLKEQPVGELPPATVPELKDRPAADLTAPTLLKPPTAKVAPPTLSAEGGRLLSGYRLVVLVALLMLVSFGALHLLMRSNSIAGLGSVVFGEGRSPAARLTTAGRALASAISADGNLVAYASEESGRQGLWVRRLSSPDAARILSPADVDFSGISFSPDGLIYYVIFENRSPVGSLYRVSPQGGSRVKVLDDVYGPVSFSPDGKRFVFRRKHFSQGEDLLLIADTDGQNEQIIARRQFPEHFLGAAWSPDGRRIAVAYFKRGAQSLFGTIELLSTDGQLAQDLSEKHWGAISALAWEPGGRYLYVAGRGAPSIANMQIWRTPLDGSPPEPLTHDAGEYAGVSVARGKLVTIKSEIHSGIWSVTFGAGERAANLLSASSLAGIWGLDCARDGRIIYTLTGSSTKELWEMNADGSNQRKLTEREHHELAPVISPDDRYLVFVSAESGRNQLWRLDRQKNDRRQLTFDENAEHPNFSPDGKWIVYTTSNDGRPNLAKVSVEGGPSQLLGPMAAIMPTVSPDGRYLAFLLIDQMGGKIAVMPLDGSQPPRSFDAPVSLAVRRYYRAMLRWTADSQAVAFIRDEDNISNIWAQPINGGPARKLTNFTAERIFYFDFCEGAKRMLVARGSINSDVMQLDLSQ